MNKINEKAAQLAEELRRQLGEIELDVTTSYTLADAIRQGSTVSEHNQSGWGNGETACALTAAVIGAKAQGYL